MMTHPAATPCRRPALRSAAALFRDEAERQELRIAVNNETGYLTATLSTPDLEASGHGQAALMATGDHSAVLATSIALSAYESPADRFCELEVSIGATWTRGHGSSTTIELAGTALVTDLQAQTITRLWAVRLHPDNQLTEADWTVASDPLTRNRTCGTANLAPA